MFHNLISVCSSSMDYFIQFFKAFIIYCYRQFEPRRAILFNLDVA